MCLGLRLIVIILAVVPASLSQSDACGVLPSDAKLFLEKRFPDWRPKNLSDLSRYDRKLWLETHAKECPGIAVGHFEQPRVAYTILLVPQAGHMASYKIIALSKGSDQYALRLLDHAEGSTYSDSGLVICGEPHGTHSEFGDTRSVQLKLDGVNVEWLEKVRSFTIGPTESTRVCKPPTRHSQPFHPSNSLNTVAALPPAASSTGGAPTTTAPDTSSHSPRSPS
jgi:hypothetical protein